MHSDASKLEKEQATYLIQQIKIAKFNVTTAILSTISHQIFSEVSNQLMLNKCERSLLVSLKRLVAMHKEKEGTKEGTVI